MERDTENLGWKSIGELGVDRDAEAAVAESIRAKVCVPVPFTVANAAKDAGFVCAERPCCGLCPGVCRRPT